MTEASTTKDAIQTPEQETSSSLDKWMLLSPMGIVYFIFQFLHGFLKQGIQGILPLIVVIYTSAEKHWSLALSVGIGIILLLVLAATSTYLRFRFKITKDSFRIKSGIFKKKSLTLKFDRIQNIAISEPFYFRPFALVTMSLESAGSSSEEVKLGGIPRQLAETYRKKILALRLEENTSLQKNTEVSSATTDEICILKQPVSELAKYGLTNNGIWVAAGIAAGAFLQIDWEDFEAVETMKSNILSIIGAEPSILIYLFISGGILLFSLLVGISVIVTITANYNYMLSRAKGRLFSKKGLFERHETSLPESKIQAIVIHQGWIAKLLKRWNIQLKQAGSQKGRSSTNNNSAKKFIVPSVTETFRNHFTDQLYDHLNLSSLRLGQIHDLYIFRTIFIILVPLFSVVTLVFWFQSHSELSFVFLAVPILGTPIVFVRKKKYGFLITGEYAVVRSGLIGCKTTIFPIFKAQTIRVSQTPGQKRANLSTLHIALAGTTLKVPYIPMQEALYWRDTFLNKIENCNKSWM